MDYSNTWQNPPLFRGRVVKAAYKEQKILDYRGNPLIEALPPIWSKQEVIDLLQRYPDYQEEYRTWATELRLHLIRRMLKFFEVLPMHIDLEQRISCTLRTGYEARNPFAPGAWRYIRDRVEALQSALSFAEGAGIEEELIPSISDLETTATGFAFLGLSGQREDDFSQEHPCSLPSGYCTQQLSRRRF
jgi:hypothetical protein